MPFKIEKVDNLIREYYSVGQASRETEVRQGSISNNCLGRTKSAGGYIWKYKNVIN